MADGHPILASAFLTLVVAGVGAGAVDIVRTQRAQRAAAVVAAEEAHKKLIVEGVQRGQSGDFEGAAVMLASALREHPDDEDAAYNLGVALSALGRHKDAEKVLSALLARAPEDWSATAELAGVYDLEGDGERAVQLLEKIPSGEADLAARFADLTLWSTTRAHARFAALAAKHHLAAAPEASAAPDDAP